MDGSFEDSNKKIPDFFDNNSSLTSTMMNLKVPTLPPQRPRQSPLGRVSRISITSPRSNLLESNDQNLYHHSLSTSPSLTSSNKSSSSPECSSIVGIWCEVLSGNCSREHWTLKQLYTRVRRDPSTRPVPNFFSSILPVLTQK